MSEKHQTPDVCLGGLGHVYVNNKCQLCGKIFYPKEAEVKKKRSSYE